MHLNIVFVACCVSRFRVRLPVFVSQSFDFFDLACTHAPLETQHYNVKFSCIITGVWIWCTHAPLDTQHYNVKF